MAELVTVGRVRPHGLDGSFVVEDASDDPERFAVGARVMAGDEAAAVVASKRAGGRMVVRLDRAVERGTILAVPRDELPPAEDKATCLRRRRGGGGRRLAAACPGVANDVLEPTRATRCRSFRSVSSRSTSNAAASCCTPSPTNPSRADRRLHTAPAYRRDDDAGLSRPCSETSSTFLELLGLHAARRRSGGRRALRGWRGHGAPRRRRARRPRRRLRRPYAGGSSRSRRRVGSSTRSSSRSSPARRS